MTNTDPSSEKQRKMFFAVSKQLGYEAEDVKNRAKLHFKVEHFNDLKKIQLNFLIDRLLGQLDKKGGEK